MVSVAGTVLLPGGGWRLWSQFALRGTGFPAAGVLRLAPPGLGVAADKFADVAPRDRWTGAEWEEFEAFFDEAAVRTARELQDIASQPRFRTALAWQNKAVLGSGIAPFLAWTPTAAGRTSMPRQREELVAHYWQRFCVKNDTIGFFGPVGWGSWDLDGPRGITTVPGEDFLACSEVYFSSWGIDALAKVIGAEPGMRPWVPPRRVSFARIADGAVSLPGRAAVPLADGLEDVLWLCDGAHQPVEIAERLDRDLDGVLAALDELLHRRWITWRIDVPASAHPDLALRAIVERVGDPEVRQRALDRIEVLRRGRDRVRAALGDADALLEAMSALENDFVETTRTSAQREKGAKTSANRALVYSDSRRAATARLGSAVLDELTPLAQCLTAARWMTNRYAEIARGHLREAFESLRAKHSVVDLASLWMACLPVPHPDSIADADRVQAELQRRWESIVDAPEGARRVRLSSAAIAEQVREAFEEPATGWNVARYISPDVFVVAEDAEAVERGEFELVLGELHVGVNTMSASLFVMQHPDQEELLAETDVDYPGPRLMPMLPKEQPPRWNTRSRPALNRPQDYLVGMVDHTADPYRPRTAMGADVLVEERDGELVAVLPDGAVFPVLDVFGNALTARIMDRFSLRAAGDHSPRVTVDNVVVARETWRFTAESLEFAAEKHESRRFVRARAWRDEHELPRYVFIVSPAEPRPFYVDFDSPVYVNVLAKAVRRLARKDPSARLTVSEMLPNPEQAWLTDHTGAKYSSELRFVAFDQTGRDRHVQD
ncbi:lantibiotic biosynthesis dehydratase-like protein [Saccharothrix carnea]|uniref:Lantibiotic biosynthesis dehydratase-like protein n=1 Tax=Saccharothrix carnea TaxID=1280637 RepID=A0A2P8IEZ8_SACCR|nr:lantibiotic dehydratase [Saccharothrix carnea]PSL57048.1 lantibiotic biosynthesis dehydratase-like protein [Saccharothrix carnea]